MEINKIYNEDCLETMKRMPDNFIDLTVTSPPYDNLREYKGYSFDFEKIAQQLLRVTRPGGVVVWIVADATIKGSETGTSFKQALYFKEIGFNLHDTMIWNKDGCPYPDQRRYNNVFEYMFVLSKPAAPMTINLIKGKLSKHKRRPRIKTFREKSGEMSEKNVREQRIGKPYPNDNIWNIQTGYMKSSQFKDAFKHPAIFPEALARDHILSWSNEGDLVYDPFTGSGTVPSMCIPLKREYIASEISKEYCEIGRERVRIELSQTQFNFKGD